MKGLISVLASLLESRTSRHNLVLLVRFLLVLFGMVALYSLLFHLLMQWEGQRHSWLTGVYWTLTVMTTLGFGDITFNGDLGRFFSMIVLVSGVVFMLVLLPFTFIEFFYAPWMRAQTAARAPRELPVGTTGHVLLTRHGPLTSVLIPMLKKYDYPYAVITQTVAEALELHEKSINAVVGELDDPETYRRARVETAAMVVTTRNDVINTSVTFTVRELAERIPIVASASSEASRGVIELAGATHVLRLEEMMGIALARRVLDTEATAHVIGDVDGVIIAEACADGTPLAGKTVAESKVRDLTGVNIIGLWEHGRLELVTPTTLIRSNSVLVLAGTRAQIDHYNELTCIYQVDRAPVVIIGGGRVGRATARALANRNQDYRIIEKLPERVRDASKTIVGDAAEIEVLQKAGISEASSVVITTHDDDANVYLTILCRRLRSKVQLISRASLERNVGTLHRAGADLVLSYGSMGANAVFNLLRGSDTLLMAEGVFVFPTLVPEALAGKTIAETAIRSRTGCTIVAIEKNGERSINPLPNCQLPAGGEMVLIGTLEAESKFLKEFPTTHANRRKTRG